MAKQRGRNTGSLFKRGGKGCYLARWYDASGRRRSKSTRTTDLATARRILSKHVEGVALRKSGVVDGRQERFALENAKPLAEHVRDYLGHCENVGIAIQSIKEKTRHLGRVLDGTGATRLSELTADSLEHHMRALVDSGLSARTANFARQDAVAFLSWCERTGRVESNTLKTVRRLDERRDRRRVRRPMTDDELGRLLDVAESHGRKAWYLAAALAGLRRGDLKRLTWADVNFAESSITIADGKVKRTDIVPMHPQLADELRRRLGANPAVPTAKVFPRAVQPRTVLFDLLRVGLAREEPMLDADGKPTGRTHIVTDDAEGRVLDLHSLRTTLGTNLARSGVAPQVAQRIMRHGDYRTTLKHYTVLGLSDSATAIGKLAPIRSPGQARESARATGTDNAPVTDDSARHPNRHQLGRETQQFTAKHCEEPDDCRDLPESRKPLQTLPQSDTIRGNAGGNGNKGDGGKNSNPRPSRPGVVLVLHETTAISLC